MAINSDSSVRMLGKGEDRPINGEADRACILASLESVPLSAVELAHPDIYVKGGDYNIEDLPEASLVSSWGGKSITVKFEHKYSTTSLLRKIRNM